MIFSWKLNELIFAVNISQFMLASNYSYKSLRFFSQENLVTFFYYININKKLLGRKQVNLIVFREIVKWIRVFLSLWEKCLRPVTKILAVSWCLQLQGHRPQNTRPQKLVRYSHIFQHNYSLLLRQKPLGWVKWVIYKPYALVFLVTSK